MSKTKNEKLSKSMQGNKNSVGNEGGRPPRFNSPEDLERECNDYFDWADENPWHHKELLRGGKEAGKIVDIPTQRPYTILALCEHLEIVLQTWLNYEEKPEFLEVCTRVRHRIDNQQFEGAAVGAFNASLIARRLGLVDRVEQKIVEEQPFFPDVSKDDSNK